MALYYGEPVIAFTFLMGAESSLSAARGEQW